MREESITLTCELPDGFEFTKEEADQILEDVGVALTKALVLNKRYTTALEKEKNNGE